MPGEDTTLATSYNRSYGIAFDLKVSLHPYMAALSPDFGRAKPKSPVAELKLRPQWLRGESFEGRGARTPALPVGDGRDQHEKATPPQFTYH